MKKFFSSVLLLITIVCSIYAQNFGEIFTPVPNDAKAVDLGLPSGTLWSNMNLGAQKISDYGDYYAWGEVQSKNVYDFKVKTYRYYAQIDSTYVDDDGFTIVETKKGYTKYVMEEEAEEYGLNGFFDNKISLDVEDDAAYVNWGCEWRIPTNDQLIELKNICLWKKVTLNGTNGYKVIGPMVIIYFCQLQGIVLMSILIMEICIKVIGIICVIGLLLEMNIAMRHMQISIFQVVVA